MKLERRDIGFGKYQWFINGRESFLSEIVIINMIKKAGKEKELWAKWDYLRYFEIEI